MIIIITDHRPWLPEVNNFKSLLLISIRLEINKRDLISLDPHLKAKKLGKISKADSSVFGDGLIVVGKT